jgi:hypothetical protein
MKTVLKTGKKKKRSLRRRFNTTQFAQSNYEQKQNPKSIQHQRATMKRVNDRISDSATTTNVSPTTVSAAVGGGTTPTTTTTAKKNRTFGPHHHHHHHHHQPVTLAALPLATSQMQCTYVFVLCVVYERVCWYRFVCIYGCLR